MTAISERYIVISSDDLLDYFPENSPTKFTTLVDPPLDISGTWVVGLCDIFVEFDTFKESKIKQPGGGHVIFDVFLSQSTGTVLFGRECSLLRRVTCLLKNRMLHTYHVTFDNPYLVKLNGSSLSKLEMDIKMVYPSSLSFRSKSSTSATLVVRKID